MRADLVRARAIAKDALLRASRRLALDGAARAAERLRGASLRVMVFHGTPARHAEAFERQLRWVKQRFEVLDPEEMLEVLDGRARSRGRPAVGLTFDDGLATNAEVAAPILERLGMRGLFFVCPTFADTTGTGSHRFFAERVRFLDDPEAMQPEDYRPMDRSMLRELRRRGHLIGNHTHSHQDLRKVSGDALSKEIVRARDDLSEWLGEPIRCFAWTFAWDAITKEAWAAALSSHRYTFTACPGRNALGPGCVWRTNVEADLPAHTYAFFYSGLADPIWWRRRNQLSALYAQAQR